MTNPRYCNTAKRYGQLWLMAGFILLLSSCLKEDIFPATGQPNVYLSLLDLRKIYKGAEVKLTSENLQGSSRITEVVITDASSRNIPPGTFAIQQTRRGLQRGIEVFVSGSPLISYKPGDSVSVDILGATLTRTKGAMQVQVATASQVTKVAENIVAEPVVVNLSTFNAKFSEYESTLIKIANVDAAANGNVLRGDLPVTDAGGTGTIHTEDSASFADKKAALNASYTGVARYNNTGGNGVDGAKAQLWPVNVASIEDESGSLYTGFREDFETADDILLNGGSYSVTKTGNLKTGNYTLTNFVLGKEINDRAVSGVYAARANASSTGSSWVTMNYDLPEGASKVTVWAGSYGASADLGSTWRLEYSQNKGTTWSQLGADILTVSKDKKLYTFLMDLGGPVRFRIGKLGIGTSTTNNQNGRFDFDDLTIYRNPGAGGPVTDPVPTYNDLLVWQFGTPQTVGNELTLNSTTTNAGLTPAALTRGPGLNVSGLARSFGSNAAGPTIPSTKSIAVGEKVYFQVKFTVKPGSTLSMSAIDVKLRRSGAGGKYHKWFYSFDDTNFTETTGTGDINYEASDAEGIDMPTYFLYQTPQLQNIPGGTTVTMRMYIWGFTNLGSGSFALGRTPAGTTTPVMRIGGIITP